LKRLLLLIAFSISAALAQNNNIVFEHLTIEDGLSQSSVKTIFQDSRGFMWFGTADGLNRYDGYNFRIFREDVRDSFNISNNSISQVAEDADGCLWIATANGLNKYDPRSEKFFRLKFHKSEKYLSYSEAVTSLFCYRDNTGKFVWFSTNDGVYKYNISSGKLDLYQIPEGIPRKSNKMLYIFRDSNKDIWASEYISGFFKFNYKKNVFERFYTDKLARDKKENWYSEIFEDSDKNLWFGSVMGLTRYNIVSGKCLRYKDQLDKAAGTIFREGFITTITELNKDYMLIGTSGAGMFVLNKNSGQVQNFTHNQFDTRAISHNVILSLYKDRSGIIWIGSNGYGLDKLTPSLSRFNFITQAAGKLYSQSIRSVFEDRYGKIWISGYSGLDQYDPKTGSFKNYYHPKAEKLPVFCDNVVYSYAEDKDEPGRYLYLGTEGSGLNRFDYLTNKFTKIYPDSSVYSEPGYKIVNAVYDDGRGYLWMGTDHALVRMNKLTRAVKEYRHNPGDNKSIGPESVTSIYEDSKGNFWIGTSLGGLSLMDRKNETFKNFRADIKNKNSISGNFVKSIFEDSKKNIWIATTNGLNKLIDISGIFKSYSIADGLPNNVVYGILEDEQGYLWLSTNHGISKFDPVKEGFRNFDVKDGLQSNEFNSFAYCKTRSGTMYFGGIKGLNSFNPSGIKDNNVVPPVAITDILLFNKPIEVGKLYEGRALLTSSAITTKSIVFDYKDNVITILFASLDYSSKGKNKYRYKLEGFDRQWSVPSPKRSATYTNLDPGEYTFRVIGSNNDGVWNTKGAVIKIIITPPFWQTWWFFVIAALAATQLVYSVYKWRIKRVEKMNTLLELQVKERTTELHNLNESLKVEIAERKSAEEDLRLLNAQKDKFFSIVAHDLKSPFHGILGYSELLAEDYQSLTETERINFINDINNISKSAFRFLENLLEWSRIQTGRIEFEPGCLNFSLEIYEVFNILIAFAMQKKISLVNSVDADVIVFADKNMLSLILRNLISNAVKFTNDGGRVVISSAEKDNFVEVTVCDNGIGIKQENLNKLFRIDTQYTSKGTRDEEGTGLGLLLCKEMIEINKGSIRVESEQGKGTKFIFTLPK
jgi:signal transduction histidine kinase/ligand-binding sensor domain-containing protein